MRNTILLLCFLFSVYAKAQVPPNDEIGNATEITSLPYIDTDVQTQNATTASGGDMNGCGFGTLTHVYYRYVATETQTLRLKISDGYTEYSVILAFEPSVDNPTSDSQLTLVSDMDCANSTSNEFEAQAGQVYYFVVGNEYYPADFIVTPIGDSSDIISFPDANFKNALVNQTDPVIDLNGDGEIQESEAFLTTKISTGSANISNVEGLENFPNLMYLYLIDNDISDIDVSNNQNLKILDLSRNDGLSSIDVTQNIALEKLYLKHSYLSSVENKITSLDLSNNELLEKLNISRNNLSDLDVTQNEALTFLVVNHNNLSSIDVSQNTDLHYLDLNRNNLSSLDVSQNNNLTLLEANNNNLSTIDVSQNLNLESLYIGNNDLTTIDVSQNITLKNLEIGGNQIETLDIAVNTNLESLSIRATPISSVDLSTCPNLLEFYGDSSELSSLDVSNNPNLTHLSLISTSVSSLDLSQNQDLLILVILDSNFYQLDLSNNPNITLIQASGNEFLEHINLKNGNNSTIDGLGATEDPHLNFICVDDVDYAVQNFTNVSPTATFTTDCSAAGQSNSLSGVIHYDENNNGCDDNDVPGQNFLVNSTDGTNTYGTFSDENGAYTLNLQEETYTTQLMSLPGYFNTDPNTVSTTYTGFGNAENQDFCLTSTQSTNDLNVVFLEKFHPFPGYDSDYQLVYENLGTSTMSGQVTLQFDNAKQDFVSATPSESSISGNTLTFNYSNLLPFESRTTDLTFHTMPPPTVDSGSILAFDAEITPSTGDSTPADNTFHFDQNVLNSYDPNAMVVLQGDEILEEQTANDLDYIIHFQNTGTAAAQNIKVTCFLDEKLDWGSFRPVSASADYHVKIINGNFVEFDFENIDLPSEGQDEDGSNGFVAFKAKPKANVVVDDTIGAGAKIYFDFNAPIATDSIETRVVDELKVKEHQVQKSTVMVYPNPAGRNFRLKTSDGITVKSIHLYSIEGVLVKTVKGNPAQNYNVENLSSGLYFMKIETDKGVVEKKLIKR